MCLCPVYSHSECPDRAHQWVPALPILCPCGKERSKFNHLAQLRVKENLGEQHEIQLQVLTLPPQAETWSSCTERAWSSLILLAEASASREVDLNDSHFGSTDSRGSNGALVRAHMTSSKFHWGRGGLQQLSTYLLVSLKNLETRLDTSSGNCYLPTQAVLTAATICLSVEGDFPASKSSHRNWGISVAEHVRGSAWGSLHHITKTFHLCA